MSIGNKNFKWKFYYYTFVSVYQQRLYTSIYLIVATYNVISYCPQTQGHPEKMSSVARKELCRVYEELLKKGLT